MRRPGSWLGQWLGMLPGRLESPGQVKRRMLLISVVGVIALGGLFAVTAYDPNSGPFSRQELRDMSGLPVPPVRFVQDPDGTYRELSPEELEQLRQLQELIRNFPAPQNFGGGSVPFVDPATPDATGGG